MSSEPESLQQHNERLQRELAQARAELEDFTYSVSHDLRASLRHVNAYVQIIREDLADQLRPDTAAHLDTVTQAAGQMTRQIEALTELSRLGRVEFQMTALDLGSLLRDAIALLGPQTQGRDLQWQLATDFPALKGDAGQVRQLLTHLLSNALKFSRKQTPSQIAVTWQMHDEGLCTVTLSDNGVGFNPQYQNKLFHAFSRLHSARDFDGLGMGLALSRKIVERHGGSIRAESAPDAGCRVSFSLPLFLA
jgi:light-regulated signal transduction histidine kinase (bacteriophytochrome)